MIQDLQSSTSSCTLQGIASQAFLIDVLIPIRDTERGWRNLSTIYLSPCHLVDRDKILVCTSTPPDIVKSSKWAMISMAGIKLVHYDDGEDLFSCNASRIRTERKMYKVHVHRSGSGCYWKIKPGHVTSPASKAPNPHDSNLAVPAQGPVTHA